MSIQTPQAVAEAFLHRIVTAKRGLRDRGIGK